MNAGRRRNISVLEWKVYAPLLISSVFIARRLSSFVDRRGGINWLFSVASTDFEELAVACGILVPMPNLSKGLLSIFNHLSLGTDAHHPNQTVNRSSPCYP